MRTVRCLCSTTVLPYCCTPDLNHSATAHSHTDTDAHTTANQYSHTETDRHAASDSYVDAQNVWNNEGETVYLWDAQGNKVIKLP